MLIKRNKIQPTGDTPTPLSRVLFICLFSLLTTASNLKGCDEDIQIGAPGSTTPSPSPTADESPTPTTSPGFTPAPSPTQFNPFLPNPTPTPVFNPSPSPGSEPTPTAVVQSAELDSDKDGLTDEEERRIGTDPFNPDTDNDGFSDGFEVQHGSDPLDSSSIPVF